MENFNATTNSFYSANNQEHLEVHKEQYDLGSNEWAGFHQWKEAGRKVKKGAKGCKIFMICDKKDEVKEGEEQTKSKVLKALYVFNKSHTEEI